MWCQGEIFSLSLDLITFMLSLIRCQRFMRFSCTSKKSTFPHVRDYCYTIYCKVCPRTISRHIEGLHPWISHVLVANLGALSYFTCYFGATLWLTNPWKNKGGGGIMTR
jgi:hypothetical protein